MGNEIPVYGLELEGSMLLESYTTTFSVLISLDGFTFSYIPDEYNRPKVRLILQLWNVDVIVLSFRFLMEMLIASVGQKFCFPIQLRQGILESYPEHGRKI